MQKSIREIQEEYELELPKIISEIKKQKAKSVLLQFPDGMKPYALAIVEELERRIKKEKIKVEFFIWLGSCYGACDIPEIEGKVDMIVQFGHSKLDNQ